MRLAAKRDNNEAVIVAALTKAGCQVIRGTDIDLIVTLGIRVELMEVKGPKGRLKKDRPCRLNAC